MGFKKISILSLVLAILLIAIPGCNGAETESLPRAPWDYESGEGMSLSLSSVPRLGETAELTFDPVTGMVPNPPSLTKARVWVEFYYANTKGSYSEAKYAVPVPIEEVLVSGELSWEGNMLEEGIQELHATVQLPREGVWIVFGFLRGKGWEKPLGTRALFAVTEEAAVIIGTPEFYAGPLGYLAHFPYGRFVKRAPEENDPVILEMDISKAPSVGEEVVLTCHINSIIDYEGYSAEFDFSKLVRDNPAITVTGDSLLVDGYLSWEGELKKDKPVEFSATIKFPEGGGWVIKVSGDDPKFPGRHLADKIYVIITNDVQYFVRDAVVARKLLEDLDELAEPE